MKDEGLISRLVGHRGWPARYPENSLSGMRAVLEAGARHVEFDVQLSADFEPVVFHDDALERLLGLPGRVGDLDLAELRSQRIRHPLKSEPSDQHPPALTDMLAAIAPWPHATIFIELKRASMRRFGRQRMLDAVLPILHGIQNPLVLISFDLPVLARVQQHGQWPIGWVFKPWSEQARADASRLEPEYLFVRADRVPAHDVQSSAPFWAGPWQWVVYGVETAKQADQYLDLGAHLVETDYLPELAGAG